MISDYAVIDREVKTRITLDRNDAEVFHAFTLLSLNLECGFLSMNNMTEIYKINVLGDMLLRFLLRVHVCFHV